MDVGATRTECNRRMPVNKRYSVAVTIAALVAALGIGLLLSESLLRLFYPQTLGVWAQTRDGLILLSLLSMYFTKDLAHTSIRILSAFMTGSTKSGSRLGRCESCCWAIPLGKHFRSTLKMPFFVLLERELRSSLGCRVEVINAGVGGWGLRCSPA